MGVLNPGIQLIIQAQAQPCSTGLHHRRAPARPHSTTRSLPAVGAPPSRSHPKQPVGFAGQPADHRDIFASPSGGSKSLCSPPDTPPPRRPTCPDLRDLGCQGRPRRPTPCGLTAEVARYPLLGSAEWLRSPQRGPQSNSFPEAHVPPRVPQLQAQDPGLGSTDELPPLPGPQGRADRASRHLGLAAGQAFSVADGHSVSLRDPLRGPPNHTPAKQPGRAWRSPVSDDRHA